MRVEAHQELCSMIFYVYSESEILDIIHVRFELDKVLFIRTPLLTLRCERLITRHID